MIDKDGAPYQVFPDYHTQEALRHEFIGNEQGLLELERLLQQNEDEILRILEEQKNVDNDNNQTD
jgi:hypothetical protein